jgi:hypothetical protein
VHGSQPRTSRSKKILTDLEGGSKELWKESWKGEASTDAMSSAREVSRRDEGHSRLERTSASGPTAPGSECPRSGTVTGQRIQATCVGLAEKVELRILPEERIFISLLPVRNDVT